MIEGPASAMALLLYAVLGLLMGVAAAAFIRALSSAEDIFDRISNAYARHAIGMLIIGVLIYALLYDAGHYYVEGVGYATIQAILAGQLGLPLLLALLFVAKLAATSISLGSGASGGIFSPSLFMGATLGGAFGGVMVTVYPIPGISVATCAMIGMAAIVGGGTGAAMTAVTMIFEMTRDYDLVMPIIIAVALAIGVRRLISQENIYTVKLVARRHFVPKALHANMFLVRRATDVWNPTWLCCRRTLVWPSSSTMLGPFQVMLWSPAAIASAASSASIACCAKRCLLPMRRCRPASWRNDGLSWPAKTTLRLTSSPAWPGGRPRPCSLPRRAASPGRGRHRCHLQGPDRGLVAESIIPYG